MTFDMHTVSKLYTVCYLILISIGIILNLNIFEQK